MSFYKLMVASALGLVRAQRGRFTVNFGVQLTKEIWHELRTSSIFQDYLLH